MRWVIAASLPGLMVQTGWFGWGNLINVVFCVITAMLAEAAVLALRRKPVRRTLTDSTAAVTGLLLGLSLPPFAPWWVSLVAVIAAIVLAKQLYGGLGSNPFNPAMVGYALVLVSFPVAMTTNWAAAVGLDQAPGLGDTLARMFSAPQAAPDGWTMATPLDAARHASTIAGAGQATAWLWVNLAFLAGGVGLLALRVIQWPIPAALLAALALMTLMFGSAPLSLDGLSLQLLSGATMLGAFFIATDPVSAATSVRGRLIYGAGIGVLLFCIRTWGNYPDAVAFAVLLMNFAVPMIDYYTPPRTFGHRKAARGLSGRSGEAP
ncbi:RnfABCDGE type electron transport complex subunit D [Marinobacter sp. C2H3]|uniref:RnfABCDGE type electron transport complex subunit D n=1 Tax=Marinobacter sp. C2H3 TaxID=3119003 RepID=UPI003FA55741